MQGNDRRRDMARLPCPNIRYHGENISAESNRENGGRAERVNLPQLQNQRIATPEQTDAKKAQVTEQHHAGTRCGGGETNAQKAPDDDGDAEDHIPGRPFSEDQPAAQGNR